MKEIIVVIKNKLGLHARAAAMLVECTSRYSSDVIVVKGEHEVDAKSIMGVMTLAAGIGTELIVRAEGKDELEVLEKIDELVERKFDEE
ncbi:MAG: HPr family phosphocarrier protein [Elusimicrobiota bacterium]